MEHAYEYFKAELEKAEAELAKWQEVADGLRKLLSDLGKRDAEPAAPREADFAALSAPGAAEAVLREAGKPLQVKQIIERMARGGFPTRNYKNLYAALSTSMSRQKQRFKRTGKGRFALVKRTTREGSE